MSFNESHKKLFKNSPIIARLLIVRIAIKYFLLRLATIYARFNELLIHYNPFTH